MDETARIVDWLSAHNLGHLAKTFEENEIDTDVLFELTDDDLREMGLSLGARKRIRAAINNGVDDTQASSPSSESASEGAGGQRSQAERRHLTIMFVDLVGSTDMSGRLDPEDMRDLMVGYQNMVAGVVTRYDGQVAKYMGDGVLCYFGWPRAHENDAERAVRSAIEIADALGATKSPTGEFLAGRIGIASGLVVVGDLIGEGAAQEEAVVGDTPNLAARLQAVAGANQVVIAASTAQLLGGVFDAEDLGALDLKGVATPTQAWRVLSERDLTSRFEARTQDIILPMVGREHELALIMERWNRAPPEKARRSC
jgi:class 3 adenylate cyclase